MAYMFPRVDSNPHRDAMRTIDRIESGDWSGRAALEWIEDAATSVRGVPGFAPSQYIPGGYGTAVATPKAAPATPKASPRPRADFLDMEITASMPSYAYDRKNARVIPAEAIRLPKDLALYDRHDGAVLGRQSWHNLRVELGATTGLTLVCYPLNTPEARQAVADVERGNILGISPSAMVASEPGYDADVVTLFEILEISLARRPCVDRTEVSVRRLDRGIAEAMASRTC